MHTVRLGSTNNFTLGWQFHPKNWRVGAILQSSVINNAGMYDAGASISFQFFHSEIANPKCKKVFLYGENRHFRLGAFNFPLHFVRLLPKSSSPSALQADAFGELTPKKIGPFFPRQLIQKLSNFSSKSLKISQNPQKS